MFGIPTSLPFSSFKGVSALKASWGCPSVRVSWDLSYTYRPSLGVTWGPLAALDFFPQTAGWFRLGRIATRTPATNNLGMCMVRPPIGRKRMSLVGAGGASVEPALLSTQRPGWMDPLPASQPFIPSPFEVFPRNRLDRCTSCTY